MKYFDLLLKIIFGLGVMSLSTFFLEIVDLLFESLIFDDSLLKAALKPYQNLIKTVLNLIKKRHLVKTRSTIY